MMPKTTRDPDEEIPTQITKEKEQQSILSKNEFVILALNAAINDLRWKDATRDSRVNELASDARKEKGAREVAEQKNAHLTLRGVNEELADLKALKHPPQSGTGGGKLVGVFIAGFVACYLFLLLAGVVHP